MTDFLMYWLAGWVILGVMDFIFDPAVHAFTIRARFWYMIIALVMWPVFMLGGIIQMVLPEYIKKQIESEADDGAERMVKQWRDQLAKWRKRDE